MKSDSNELSAEQKALARKALRNPVLFANGFLGARLWERQAEILQTIATQTRIAIRASHAVGKSFVLAIAVLWWLARYRDGIALMVAPTERQIETVLWPEIRRVVARAKVPYPKIMAREFKLRGDNNFALGLSTNQAPNFQGYHGKEVLVIIDEAPGVASDIFDAIDGIAAGGNVPIVMAGNPTNASGPFYQAFTKERALWNCISIDAFDSPNVRCICNERHDDFTIETLRSLPPGLTENDSPVFAHKPWRELVSRFWVYQMYWKHGEASAFWVSRVRGQFPTQSGGRPIPAREAGGSTP